VNREIFVDAGAWIALSNVRDKYHTAAIPVYQQLLHERWLLVTTDLVVAEAHVVIRRVGGYGPAMRFLESLRKTPRLIRMYANAALDAQAEAILRRYADQDFSFADAVSFAVMQERGITEAFAFDQHFRTAGFALLP